MSFGDVLNYPFIDLGGGPITLGSLVFAIVVIVVTIIAARLLVRVLSRMRARMHSGAGSIYILEKLGGYAVIIVGIVFALSTLGVNLSSLAVFAGALGVGVGLGLQGVVKEFVSGIVLLFDDIIQVGDYVEIPGAGNVKGAVMSIGSRATRIRTNDNINVLVPNSRLIEEPFINWTLKGQSRRIHVPFTVAYGVDKAKVRDVVLAAARSLPTTQEDTDTRKSQVWMVGFADSALNFELIVWPTLDAAKRPAAMQAAYTWAIDDALRKAEIEMPFPQLDLRLRSMFGHENDDGLRAIGQRPISPTEEAHAHVATRNDAAHDLLQGEDPAAPEPGEDGEIVEMPDHPTEPRPPSPLRPA